MGFTAPVLSLALAAVAPTITATGTNNQVNVPTLAMSLSTVAPSVSQGNNGGFTAPVLALTLSAANIGVNPSFIVPFKDSYYTSQALFKRRPYGAYLVASASAPANQNVQFTAPVLSLTTAVSSASIVQFSPIYIGQDEFVFSDPELFQPGKRTMAAALQSQANIQFTANPLALTLGLTTPSVVQAGGNQIAVDLLQLNLSLVVPTFIYTLPTVVTTTPLALTLAAVDPTISIGTVTPPTPPSGGGGGGGGGGGHHRGGSGHGGGRFDFSKKPKPAPVTPQEIADAEAAEKQAKDDEEAIALLLQ